MNSDDSATSALTALCEAASKARKVGDDNDGDIRTVSTVQQKQELGSSSGSSITRPALTVDLCKGGRTAPKAMSSMSVDFSIDDEDDDEDGSSISDSGFSTSTNSISVTTKSNPGDEIGSDAAASSGSRQNDECEGTKKPEDASKIFSRKQLEKKRKSADGSNVSGKRRRRTASSSTATKRTNGSKRSSGSLASADEELCHAISKIPKPKRAMTAYNFYFQTERKKIVDMGLEAYEAMMAGQPLPDAKECSKGNAPFQMIGKTIGKYWKLVPEDDLKRYRALANDDAKRYERERKIYTAEVASIKAAWRQKEQSNRKGHPSSSALCRSAITESEHRSSCTNLTEVAAGNEETLYSIINSLTKEQVHLLLSLHTRQGQNRSPQQQHGHNPLLAPVIERLENNYLGAVITANPSPASGSIVASAEQIDNPDVSSILFAQSQQIAQLQNQITTLQQQQQQTQQQEQHSPSIPFALPQQNFSSLQSLQQLPNWQSSQLPQQQQEIMPLLAITALQRNQPQQSSYPSLNENQQQQLLPSVPAVLQGTVLDNLNSQGFLQQGANNGNTAPQFFGPGGILDGGQYGPPNNAANSNIQGVGDQSFAALIGQLQSGNGYSSGNSADSDRGTNYSR